MSNLKAKLKKQGGFTLIEMLIVVAIIAILIAIAIPMVNSALEAARESTDSANERAAIGIAMADYMMGADDAGGVIDGTADVTTYYVIDAANKKGTLGAKPAVGYGKGTAAGAINADNVGKVIEVKFTKTTGEITTSWVTV